MAFLSANRFKVDTILSFYTEGTGGTLQRTGLEYQVWAEGLGVWGWRHVVGPAPRMNREHHPPVILMPPPGNNLSEALQRSHTDWMLWRTLAYVGVCILGTGPLSPAHSHLWPRESHWKQQLLLQPPNPSPLPPFLSVTANSLGKTSAPFQGSNAHCTSTPVPHLHCRRWTICPTTPDQLQPVESSKLLCCLGAESHLLQGGLNPEPVCPSFVTLPRP